MSKVQENNKLCTCFSTIIVLYPLLAMYTLKGTLVYLSEIFLLPIIIVCFFDLKRTRTVLSEFILLDYFIFLLYIILSVMVNLLARNNTLDRMYMFALIVFRFVVIAFFVKKYFDINVAIRVLRWVSLFATFYIIVQTILLETTGFYLRGDLDGAFLSTRGDLQTFAAVSRHYGIQIRPRSIFMEPAHYVEYVLSYLTISLFRYRKKELLIQCLISIGILFSMSSTGIICMALIWGLYMLLLVRDGLHPLVLVIVILFACIAIHWVVNSGYFYRATSRIYAGALENRTQGYRILGEYLQDDILLLLFGGLTASIKNDVWYAGYALLIQFAGMIGAILLFKGLLNNYKHGLLYQKMLIVLFLILNVGTEVIFDSMVLIYIPFFALKYSLTINPKRTRKKILVRKKI